MPRLPRKTTLQPDFDTFKKDRFCSFPYRHGEPRGKPETRDETCWSIKTSISCETSSNFDTLWLQNRCFPTSFLMNLEICYLKIESMFRTRLPSYFSTLSPLDAALTIRFAKTRNTTRLITSKVLGLLRKMTMEVVKVLRLPRKLQWSAMHFLKTTQKYCACHTKPLSTSYETRLNVTKCHPCHAKRSNATLETSKSDPCCRTYNRHGHTALTRTLADGC